MATAPSPAQAQKLEAWIARKKAGVPAALPVGAPLRDANAQRTLPSQSKELQAAVARAGMAATAPHTPLGKLKAKLSRSAKKMEQLEASVSRSILSPQPVAAPAPEPAQAPQSTAAAAAVAAAAEAAAAMQEGASRQDALEALVLARAKEAKRLAELGSVSTARSDLEKLAREKAAEGVVELAVYWIARARLEEDAGEERLAREIFSQGEAALALCRSGPDAQRQRSLLQSAHAEFQGRKDKEAEAAVEAMLRDAPPPTSARKAARRAQSPAPTKGPLTPGRRATMTPTSLRGKPERVLAAAALDSPEPRAPRSRCLSTPTNLRGRPERVAAAEEEEEEQQALAASPVVVASEESPETAEKENLQSPGAYGTTIVEVNGTPSRRSRRLQRD